MGDLRDLHLGEALSAKLARFGALVDGSPEQLALEGLEEWLDTQIGFYESLEEAEAEIERGEFYTHEQMEDWFNQQRAARAAE